MKINEIKQIKSNGENLTKEAYIELKNRLSDLARAYYDDDAPIVTDYEYDMLMVELKACEKIHPDWVSEDSISQTIGGTASSKFTKVKHDVPMLSIEDVFDKESVKVWVDSVKKVHPDAAFTVEEKIDGLSCTLRYKASDFDQARGSALYKLTLAETRGNGMIGEDVTENILQVNGIREKMILPYDTFGNEFQLRGEIYMTQEDFYRYNAMQPEDKKAANPRNLAAGTLRQKDAALVKERGLHMFIFNVQKVVGNKLDNLTKTQYEGLRTLNSFFDTVLCYYADDFETIDKIIDQMGSTKGQFGYDIDGAVIKVNQKGYQKDFPSSSKYSAGHIAYKYPQEEKKARVTGVDVAIGRTGKLTFTAEVCDDETNLPLQMCGTEVSRVTLHNMDYIRERHIGVGGVYGIIKSGEIIPKLTETVYKEPAKIFDVPAVCPFCGAPVAKNKDGVDYYCSNEQCDERAIQQLDYFAGRDQMDIRGLSIEKIRFLHNEGYIDAHYPVNLYNLLDQGNAGGVYKINGQGPFLEDQPGWEVKSVGKLIDSIEETRNTDFVRVMTALGLDNIGHGQSKLLKKAIENYDGTESKYFDRLIEMYANGYDFSTIEGFGPTIKKSLDEFCQGILDLAFSDRNHKAQKYADLLNELTIPEIKKKEKGSDTLKGMTFVITGSVHDYKNRDEFKESVEARGGKVSGSVSSKTSFLVNNDVTSTSGKNKKAQELGIEIISEDEFISRFGR